MEQLQASCKEACTCSRCRLTSLQVSTPSHKTKRELTLQTRRGAMKHGSSSVQASRRSEGHLGKHSEEQIPQFRRDLGLGREAQGLMLHHLEQLEHRCSVEGDAAKHKGVQASAQRIDVCRSAPAIAAHRRSEVAQYTLYLCAADPTQVRWFDDIRSTIACMQGSCIVSCSSSECSMLCEARPLSFAVQDNTAQQR